MDTITKNLSVNEDKSIKPFPVLNSSRQDVGGRLTAEERITRDAILDVIDDGDPQGDLYNINGPTSADWNFDTLDTPLENERRMRFVDAVVARARRIKQVDEAETVLGETMSTTTETKEQRIARLEAMQIIFPDCPGCRYWYEHPNAEPFAPSHNASSRCESGKHPHCTCDTCF